MKAIILLFLSLMASSTTYAGLKDAIAVVARGGGTFDVLCSDFTHEVVTATAIERNYLCLAAEGLDLPHPIDTSTHSFQPQMELFI
jgi:hypothetical protein